MEQAIVRKNGLLYSEDLKTVVGVDTDSNLFNGRIPFGAHFIDDEVFTECPYESVSIPDSVEKLGSNLFCDSTELQKVKLPATIMELAPYMFSGCTKLTKITMPNELYGFSEGLFNNCTSLEEIPFRAGIEELPENVFSGCTALKTLVIPNTVKTICSCAAAYCSNLKVLVLPASLEEMAEDAFAGCNAIRNIRIDGSNDRFFVSEEDGCLYERTEEGNRLRLTVSGVEPQDVAFYKENVDDETDDFFSNEDFNEIDETFSPEVKALDESEEGEVGIAEEEKRMIMGEPSMNDETNVNAMLADILGEEKARAESVNSSVTVDDRETQILTQMMDVMSDQSPADDSAKVSDDELAKLFASNELVEQKEPVADINEIDNKTKILIDSVAVSKIIECTPVGEVPVNHELFVIAERTVKDEAGNDTFSAKLEKCSRTFAHVQDFKRIIMLSGLPVDNEEFMQFYYHFIGLKNVVFACEAPNPASLSDYAKTICEQSKISLERNELLTQRKQISIKNDSLIKLVIQDKFD